MIINYIGTFIVSYIVGSISPGFFIARLLGVSDIRHHGSGSTGATNVARVLGLPYFFLIFLLDALKAYVLLLAVQAYNFELFFVAVIGLLLGNAYSIFLKFQAGKGIATSCGIIAFFNPYLLMPLFVVWLTIYIITRTVGIASVFSLVALLFFSATSPACVRAIYIFIALLGLWLHRKNILHVLPLRPESKK